MYSLALHFHTGTEFTHASIPEAIHSQMGGRLARIDPRRKRADDASVSTHFKPEKLEELQSLMMSAERGGIIDVTEQCAAAMLNFLVERPGTINDFQAILVTCTPDQASQHATIKVINGLRTGDVNPAKISLICACSQNDTTGKSEFDILRQYLNDTPPPINTTNIVVFLSRALENALQNQIPLGAVIHGAVDFQSALEDARRTGAEQKILQKIAQKLLSQRMLLHARTDIEQLFQSLKLPRISSQEWLEESARFDRKETPPIPSNNIIASSPQDTAADDLEISDSERL